MMPGGPPRAWIGAAFGLLWLFAAGAGACRRSANLAPRDLCVELAASVTARPPKIALSWPAVPLRQGQILVHRKDASAPAFGGAPVATLAAGTQGWVDADVEPGRTYDYFVERALLEGYWQSAGF